MKDEKLERGCARPVEQEILSRELDRKMKEFLAKGGEINRCGGPASSISEIKDKGMIDVELVKVNQERRRPKG